MLSNPSWEKVWWMFLLFLILFIVFSFGVFIFYYDFPYNLWFPANLSRVTLVDSLDSITFLSKLQLQQRFPRSKHAWVPYHNLQPYIGLTAIILVLLLPAITTLAMTVFLQALQLKITFQSSTYTWPPGFKDFHNVN